MNKTFFLDERNHLGYGALTAMAALGVTMDDLSDFERGKKYPPEAICARMCMIGYRISGFTDSRINCKLSGEDIYAIYKVVNILHRFGRDGLAELEFFLSVTKFSLMSADLKSLRKWLHYYWLGVSGFVSTGKDHNQEFLHYFFQSLPVASISSEDLEFEAIQEFQPWY